MADIFSVIQPLHDALDYHLERHNVLASNVAHVDTPGYVPRDIARSGNVESFASVLNVAMARTNEAHMAGASNMAATTGTVFEDPSSGAGNDRNFVSLDREAAKLAANQIRYDVDSTLATAELAKIAYAAGDAKGA
ncbi:MAG TPA: flagellar basal body rod protein FlgB [Polyangiaceae bacterium]